MMFFLQFVNIRNDKARAFDSHNADLVRIRIKNIWKK